MIRREIIRAIVTREPASRCGFWLGNPFPDTWPILHRYFGTKSEEALREKLGDDYRWISPQFFDSTYRHPEGKKIFDLHSDKSSHGEAGPLAECHTAAEVEKFDWPLLEFLDFSETIARLRDTPDAYRASGFWCPFFHDVMDLFGMEQYMVKMHTNPAVVHAVTERVCQFYLEANDRFYEQAGGLIDGFFFGNDFGTQLDLLVSPALFDEFVLPWFRRFTDQAHGRGYQVILHSCGSIYGVIDRLVEAGVNCLHPLQARARNMDAETLARDFSGKIAFMGAVDTQRVLNQGTPAEVKTEVRRLKEVLGPHYIVSPSHEAILPDVPPQNVAAMAEASHE
ncbi:MAG: uroporphyrinogen decarboxylase family protein [Acidobacteriota bacterium]